MPSKVIRTFRTGSQNWRSFLDGKITPDTLLEREYFGPIAAEVQTALDESGEYTKKLLEKTVTGWSDPPVFVVSARGNVRDLRQARAELVFLATGPGAEKWKWVEKGTPAHLIPREGRKPIAPMPIRRYKPMTRPGTGLPRHYGPASYGKPYFASGPVNHPGIRPRNFSERIAKHLREHKKLGFLARISLAVMRAKRRLKK